MLFYILVFVFLFSFWLNLDEVWFIFGFEGNVRGSGFCMVSFCFFVVWVYYYYDNCWNLEIKNVDC